MEFKEFIMLENVLAGNLLVPQREIQLSFVRSGGPGGQNVNKLNTKAVLKWDVENSIIWQDNEEMKNRFFELFSNQINKDGILVLSSEKSRKQSRNKKDVLEKLKIMLLQAQAQPKERVETQPSSTQIQKRLDYKKQLGQKKSDRQFNKFTL